MKGVCQRSRQVEKHGNACLDEVVSTSSINQNNKTMVAEKTIEAKGSRHHSAFHGVQANMRNWVRVWVWGLHIGCV